MGQDLISFFKKLTDNQKQALQKMRLKTLRDLLYHFPTRYGGTEKAVLISALQPKMQATIFGKISKIKIKKTFRTRIPMTEATISDDTDSVKAVWFNQTYIGRMFQEESLVRIEGIVSENKSGLFFSNPHIEKVSKIPEIVGDSLFGEDGEEHSLYPVYQESKGITSNWIYHALNKIFASEFFQKIEDPLPQEILQKYSLPSLKTALVWIHTPKKSDDALAARKRFAFEEVFFIQLQNEIERKKQKKEKSFVIDTKAIEPEIKDFVQRFPFSLTLAQEKTTAEILKDLSKPYPMSRLLEGDVGSGKTAVAATTAFAIVEGGKPTVSQATSPTANEDCDPEVIKPQSYALRFAPQKSRVTSSAFTGPLQVAYMAPTEILAKQHFESFIKLFRHLPISIGLITGSGCRKFPSKVSPNGWTNISRNQFLKWVSNGEISIIIGTHALIQESVKFRNLALAIIDEQHRFGTRSRQKITKKDPRIPHLLSMTATPIPRTLALTIYGDLDLSLLDELPEGRQKTKTEIVLPNEREKVYEKIKSEINSGRQAYVICPKINAPELGQENIINSKSVKEEAKRLKKFIFPEFEIGTMHGKMTPTEKDKTMEKFEAGKIDILVATSVVEVGVNVPNATMIIIEGAERFGLAQLHQLRGRVQRSEKESFCFVFTESESEKTLQRLKALETARNGFELSELDLKLRGAGELSGGKQWGLSDLAMEAIKNIKMVEAARLEAKEIVAKNSNLKNYPFLAKVIENKKEVHFE